MERISPLGAGDDSVNWATNDGITRNGLDAVGNPVNGTPKARNSAYQSQKPTAIADLVVDQTSYFGQIKLTWSAPRDPDSPQSELKYDLRYATHSFDILADWENAVKVASQSMPRQVADFGQPQSSSFAIYDYNADYYFAIKTTDGAGWSEVSNQPKYAIKPAISDEPLTFRGPARPSVSWEFQIPDGGYPNQPVAAKEGTIYFGASTLETPTLGKVRLYAISPSGTESWRFEENHTDVPTTPAVLDDGAVYFGHGSAVSALSPDGALRWRRDSTGGTAGIGADENGNAYFTSGAPIRVNEPLSKVGPGGGLKWQVFSLTAAGSIPVALPGDNDIYLGFDWSGLPGFYRLKGEDGSPVWQSRVSDGYTYSAYDPVFDKATDKFYTATTAGHLLEVNRSDGAIDSYLFAFGVPATTKVAVLEEILIVGVDFSSQNPASGQAVLALNKDDKSIIWTFPVDSRVNKQITADTDGNLYFATQNGKVYSLAQNGQKRWIFDLGAPTELYPVLGENAVFIGVNSAGGGKLVKIADN
jgi:hypothetical protein